LQNKACRIKILVNFAKNGEKNMFDRKKQRLVSTVIIAILVVSMVLGVVAYAVR